MQTLEHCGCRLAYTLSGAGPPVLLVQGVAVAGTGWQPQVDGLAARYRCLTYDNRGMGASQPVGAPISVAQLAQDALALLDAQGWDMAHVVGHSLGGLVALHLALEARARVRSLALLCTFAGGPTAAPLSRRLLWLGLRSRLGPRHLRRRAFLELIMPPADLARADRDALAARLAPLFGHDLADQPPIASQQLAAMRAYNAAPRLGELAGLPTLILTGAHDPIAPPSAGRVLRDGIPGSRYVEWADASHGAPIQHAQRTNALLAEHFAQADAAR